jgi:hypothetical protein
MSKVVNLNQFRKQKAKQTRVKQAETNRRLHGRTKAERANDALRKKRLETSVDHAEIRGRHEAGQALVVVVLAHRTTSRPCVCAVIATPRCVF